MLIFLSHEYKIISMFLACCWASGLVGYLNHTWVLSLYVPGMLAHVVHVRVYYRKSGRADSQDGQHLSRSMYSEEIKSHTR